MIDALIVAVSQVLPFFLLALLQQLAGPTRVWKHASRENEFLSIRQIYSLLAILAKCLTTNAQVCAAETLCVEAIVQSEPDLTYE